MLRLVFLGSGCSVLMVTERHRIYAVTRRNRTIVSCLGVITISQFALGLYATAYAAARRCESVTLRRPRVLPTRLRFSSGTDPTDPASGLYDVHLREPVVCDSRIYHHVSCIRYETLLVLRLGGIHSDCPTDSLAFSVIVYLVVRSNVNKIPIPGLLKIIVRDATRYFLVIFTSHLVFAMFLAFASVRISS
jgi:hypothetical protein